MFAFQYTITNLLHGTISLEKLTVAQILKKFQIFYGARKFVKIFTRARPLATVRSKRNPIHELLPDSFNDLKPSGYYMYHLL
jgi:hypothetical protein